MIIASIIIPVFNNWSLTRDCLKSIAANTDLQQTEIIVVDNASTDETAKGCPFLGQKLFGDNFRYISNAINRNFAGASNQGADVARGKFLVFLNNDTLVLPGWLPPLINDFTIYPRIGATGPVLLYPDDSPFGPLVQHLGVFISPSLKLGHLYEGMPAASALARKRRFFQVITAACMVMRRGVFLESGKFDEKFINGFEDVDLCARLTQQDLLATVNPESRVIHHESQTPGRHDHSAENSRLVTEKTRHILKPDWPRLIKEDGLICTINHWLRYQPELSPEMAAQLAPGLAAHDQERLKNLLLEQPFWQQGWQKALELAPTPQEQVALMRVYMKMFRNPATALAAYAIGTQARDRSLAETGAQNLMAYANTPQYYLRAASDNLKLCQETGSTHIATQFSDWIKNYENFKNHVYASFARNYLGFARETGQKLKPKNSELYNIWLYGSSLAQPRNHPHEEISFSILMPVYNPKPEYLRAALDSIMAQTHTSWELCMADDASTDQRVGQIIREYASRDKRIKISFRQKNGHISAATNTALEMASHSWCLLMDHDDTLPAHALAEMANAIASHPQALLFYSDEDKIDEESIPCVPYFKNGKWDWELLVGQNFITHLSCWRTERLRQIGGCRKGYEGAQDYDLALRYTAGADPDHLVHVPHVLYHWRMHDGSTAIRQSSKNYAFKNAARAIQDWLDKNSPGAVREKIPGRLWHRVRYPLPEEQPLVSLLVPPELASSASSMTGWPVEILQGCHPDPDFITSNAKGEILCFLAAMPSSRNWLEELLSCLLRPNIGAVGGKVTRPGGGMLNGGYLTDATGLPKPLFAGAEKPSWYGWDALARTVDALDGNCLVTRKKDFLAASGLDTSMGKWCFQDYCLRLAQSGLRSVWWPFAEFTAIGMASQSIPPLAFRQKWQGRTPPFNPNLLIAGKGFALCTN